MLCFNLCLLNELGWMIVVYSTNNVIIILTQLHSTIHSLKKNKSFTTHFLLIKIICYHVGNASFLCNTIPYLSWTPKTQYYVVTQSLPPCHYKTAIISLLPVYAFLKKTFNRFHQLLRDLFKFKTNNANVTTILSTHIIRYYIRKLIENVL